MRRRPSLRTAHNVVRVTRAHWYRLGGFRNSSLFRRHQANRGWMYFIDMGYSA